MASWDWLVFSGGTSGRYGGTLGNSFKDNMAVSDLTAPRLQRERMDRLTR